MDFFWYLCRKLQIMRIKELIKEKGLTQKEFAERLGMTTVGLSQIINGKPSYTTMEKIASALNVEIWELLVSREEIKPYEPSPSGSVIIEGQLYDIILRKR